MPTLKPKILIKRRDSVSRQVCVHTLDAKQNEIFNRLN